MLASFFFGIATMFFFFLIGIFFVAKVVDCLLEKM